MGVKESNEITVKIKSTLDEFYKIMEEKGFKIVDKFSMDDTYFIPKELKLKEISTREILSKALLVRDITGKMSNRRTKLITFKTKKFDEAGNILNQESVNCNIMEVEEAKMLLKTIGYKEIMNVKENDICPNCGGKLYFKKGIEIGNTFKLGTKYSEALNLNYTDELNQLKPVVMGSYGIGLGRCMAAIVEQNNDDKGIIWPIEVAPFKCAIIIANTKDTLQVELANKIYDNLIDKGIEPLLDDRDERMGVKLNDIDLIGIPIRIVVGRKAVENIIELKRRDSEEVFEINIENIIEYIK